MNPFGPDGVTSFFRQSFAYVWSCVCGVMGTATPATTVTLLHSARVPMSKIASSVRWNWSSLFASACMLAAAKSRSFTARDAWPSKAFASSTQLV